MNELERQKLLDGGYVEVPKTMSMALANTIGMIMSLCISAICLLIFLKFATLDDLKRMSIPILIMGTLILTVVHELMHGIPWALFCKNKFKSIKFGVKWKYLTPYCHCKEILKLSHYTIGVAMPLIITGIIPYIISVITVDINLLIISLAMIAGASGDIIMLFMVCREKGSLVCDYPDRYGCIVYRKKHE